MKKRFSKVLSVLLSLFILLTMTSVAFAAGGTLEGSGTQASPYLIADAADFDAVAANPAAYDGKYLALKNDISLPTDFTPIGSEGVPFKGIFDGKDYKISGNGETIGDVDVHYFGVFGCVENAKIKNFVVTGMTFSCGRNIGIVAGYAKNSEISGVEVRSSSIEADEKAGGIVGYLQGGLVADCRSDTTISLYEGSDVGGIVGRVEGGQVLRCINSGAVAAENTNCGGIVGYCDGKITHCINSAQVSSSNQGENSTSANVAGIAGYLNGEISYCGNAGAVTSELESAGIFCGSGTANVSYCYNAGNVTSGGSDRPIGFVGDEDTVANCIGVDATITAESLKSKDAYTGWDFDTVWFEPADYHGYAYPVLRDCNFHAMTESVLSELSCTTPEIIRSSCVCGYSYDVTTKQALDHAWNDGEVTLAPTCSDKGVKTFTCTRCDETKTEEIAIDPEAHEFDENNICKLCGAEKKQEEEVKKNIFQKIADFFKMIIDWIKNLFTPKKDR